MRHYYGIDRGRGFANEFSIWAFKSKESRDNWVDQNLTRRNRITSKEARRMLSGSIDGPDYRSGVNCYLGSKSYQVDKDRWEECMERIWQMRSIGLPVGASAIPVEIT